MNRVILKEQSKKKEKEEEKKKKKTEPIRITKEIIRHKLITHFRNHIGERNKTTQEEIFQVVIGVNSYMVNSYARFYFWEQIEKIIRELRRKDVCFTIKKKGCYFVLKDQDEANYYKGVCDNAIGHMENAKERADAWVEEAKWRAFEQSNDENDDDDFDKPEPEEKPTTIKEKVDNNINKANKKIIKLWKGEKENEK